MVYRHLEAFSVDFPEDRSDDQGFRSTERMVAYEQVFSVRIKVLFASDAVCDAYVFEGLVAEAYSMVVLRLHNAFVDVVLMDTLLEEAKSGKPLLGICLGMQLLFEKSYEYGEHFGLGLVSGEIRSIEETVPRGLKIPHIGWNALSFTKKCPIFKYLKDGDYVYFVHSYHGVNCEEATVATTDYGAALTAAVQNKNVFGCQFHPEKSGEVGLKILKAFCELEGCSC